MREILFRGKRLDRDKWVEGAFCPKNCDDPFGPMVDKPSIIKLDAPCDGFWFDVDPATVGQYTGLTDRNGKKIFEGDVVICSLIGGDIYHQPYSWNRKTVVYERGAFCVEDRAGDTAPIHDYATSVEIEVIGNIHDNPELIGGDTP